MTTALTSSPTKITASAGPALFTAVSIALLVFFWWLLIASNPGH